MKCGIGEFRTSLWFAFTVFPIESDVKNNIEFFLRVFKINKRYYINRIAISM